MGNWFSNLHIRKNDSLNTDIILELLSKNMFSQNYSVASSPSEADISYAIITSNNSNWFSVYSNAFSFEDPESLKQTANPLSESLKTNILGISCFDSNYMYLNLINNNTGMDAWLSVGSTTGFGIKRRNNLSVWKKVVSDTEKLKEISKKPYLLIEDSLSDLELLLNLPAKFSGISYEDFEDNYSDTNVTHLHFKAPNKPQTIEPPKFICTLLGHRHCVNESCEMGFLNIGGASKGFKVYFIGDFVENDELTFTDVYIRVKNTRLFGYVMLKFKPKKIRLSTGEWVYYFHAPNFRIPPKIDEDIPRLDQARQQGDRTISLHYIPVGNPVKLYDFALLIVPDKNPEGGVIMKASNFFKDKKAFIKFYNSRAIDRNDISARRNEPIENLPLWLRPVPLIPEDDID